VQSAALRYFGVPAAKLTLAQSALIAGLIKAPEAYNPFVSPQLALQRRDEVLDDMAKYHFATKADVAQAKAQPIGLHPGSDDTRIKAPFFVGQVEKFVLSHKEFGA